MSLYFLLALAGAGPEPVLALFVTVCLRTISETLTHGAELGRLLLLLPFGIGLIAAAGEAVHFTIVSRRLASSLALIECQPTARLSRLARKCGLRQRLTLVCAERPLAFTSGLIRPKVWLSTGVLALLADSELEAVLRHEAYHLKMRDPLKILLARGLSRVLFFVPVARDLFAAYSLNKEIAADAHAARTMADARPLAGALRKLIGAPSASAYTPAFIEAADAIEARLRALLDPANPLPPFGAAHLGVSLLWMLVLAAAAISPAAGHVPSFAECSASAAHHLWTVRVG